MDNINIIEHCPVPILQSPWEFSKLLEIYKTLKPRKVVEIGSFYGGTLWWWTRIWGRRYYSEYGSDTPVNMPGNWGSIGNLEHLTSIDYPIGPSDSRYEEMLRCRAMWPEWTAGIDFHDIQGDSHNQITVQRVKQLYPDNDVDFLFIDGDHSYAGVKADFENYSTFVRPGGLIVFHDVCGLPEVKQYWQEIKGSHRATEICEPEGWGIGIIEV
ncbi:Methyltransferase domain-containing protein [Chitinophaga sp. YR573]|uniref:class I SAM-dependent methyltransferase n=1 Tax=Chitinophaga sp. YR573 TaxID=1881040 RepID=UPI0008B193EE|nr:class I SAM-dependent methyltransferase [Chitinophaga sp. YR573]SEV88801.1 Methyltransferase domain-containing protein [Chitinophaga sp. YR573]